jgi:hypothetical protein
MDPPALPGRFRPLSKVARWARILPLVIALAGCGAGTDRELDPTPEKLDGTPSHEFESDDLNRAEDASDAVKDYCADAVSEAQRLGCESHVDDEDLP